jgi:hypothetical protein
MVVEEKFDMWAEFLNPSFRIRMKSLAAGGSVPSSCASARRGNFSHREWCAYDIEPANRRLGTPGSEA